MLKVVSLFDGISCCQLALKNIDKCPDIYYSSEIDKNAVSITQKHFPDTIQLGDVTKIDFTDNKFKNTTLLSGGSPCQNFSFAGSRNGLKVKDEEIYSLGRYLELKESGFEFKGQSYLFWEFVNALTIVKPRYFLLENVVMAKKWEEIITHVLGIEPLKINSAVVTAQKRHRLYWTNIPVQSIEPSRDIKVRDIVEDIDEGWLNGNLIKVPHSGIQGCLGIGGLVLPGKSTWVANPSSMSHFRQSQRVYSLDGKSTTLTTSNQTIYDFGDKYRRLVSVEMERLQGVPDGYTSGLSNTARAKVLGNGWTVPVIENILKNIDREN